MSVLIKGMDMPRCCKVCKFSYYTVGKLMRCLFSNKAEDYVQRFSQNGERDLNCPLAEVPTPHGRLIDADALSKKDIDNSNYPSNYIKVAPTIIEAEE